MNLFEILYDKFVHVALCICRLLYKHLEQYVYVCGLSCNDLNDTNPSCQLRGPGVFDLAKVEIEFSVAPDRGECQLPDAFYRIKKYFS